MSYEQRILTSDDFLRGNTSMKKKRKTKTARGMGVGEEGEEEERTPCFEKSIFATSVITT